MKKIRSLIVLFIILLIIVIIAIIVLNKNYIHENKKDEEQRIINTSDIETEWKKIDSRQEYFQAKDCLEKYYNNLEDLSNKELYIYQYGFSEEKYEELLQEKIEKNYYIIDENCLNDLNITKDNIVKYYIDNYISSSFYIDNIYRMDENQNITVFLVYGKLRDTEKNELYQHGFMIKMDKYNLAFSIYTYEYMKKNNILEKNIEQGEINIKATEEIKANEYNTYKIKIFSQSMISEDYFTQYKNALLYDKDKLYNLLDSEYKKKKFNSKESFYTYIDNNSYKLKKAFSDKYKVIEQEGYTQYIIIDQNGKYYIFNETLPMQYSVILDTYTIDLPQFIEKYSSANAQGRMALNLQKFFDALNDKDYNYAYNCLADSFKNNYFNTLESFEEYAKNNFYDNMEVDYGEFKENTGMYTYKIKITNIEEENPLTTEKTFIMKLKEETKFELSFNI